MIDYSYIKQMQHEKADEEGIRVIGLAIANREYMNIAYLRKSMGNKFVNRCVITLSDRIDAAMKETCQ